MKRYPITGSVTYQGKPVDYGAISFEPTESAGAIAPTCHAPVRKGTYDTGAKGPVEGLYRVVVHGMDESKNYMSDGLLTTPSLFPEYAVEVRIPPPNNKFDIEVPSGPTSPQRQ